jgi:hypothetical protein
MAKTTKTTTVAGKAGGVAVVRRYGKTHMRTIGSIGGNTVMDKYGSQFFSLIGKLGAHSTNGGTMSDTAVLKTQRAIRRLISENW